MRKINLFFTVLCMSVLMAACSDNIQEMDTELVSPGGNGFPIPSNTVLGANYTVQVGSGFNACTEYYVYANAGGGYTVNFDRVVTIHVIRDARTNPDTGMWEPPALIGQHVLTIPSGSSVSSHSRILATATEEYNQNFTYHVESITDTQGNALSGYTLLDRTYLISGNCHTSGPGGGGIGFN